MVKGLAKTVGVLSLVMATGCLISLTESFEYDVLEETGNEFLDVSGTDDTVENIDLSDDETFEDNRDKIKNVDRVGFEAEFYSLDGESSIVDIFFREDVSDPWMLLLEGIAVDGASTETAPTVISYGDSEDIVKNFEVFQEVAEGGVMQLGLQVRDGGATASVRVIELILIITITAGT